MGRCSHSCPDVLVPVCLFIVTVLYLPAGHVTILAFTDSVQAQWSERLLSRTNMIDGQPFLIPIPQPNPWFWFSRGRHDPYFTIVASVAVPTQMSGRSCNRVLVLVGAPTDCFRDDCVCIPRYAGGEIVAMCMCRGVIQFVTGHLRPCDSCRVRAPLTSRRVAP